MHCLYTWAANIKRVFREGADLGGKRRARNVQVRPSHAGRNESFKKGRSSARTTGALLARATGAYVRVSYRRIRDTLACERVSDRRIRARCASELHTHTRERAE